MLDAPVGIHRGGIQNRKGVFHAERRRKLRMEAWQTVKTRMAYIGTSGRATALGVVEGGEDIMKKEMIYIAYGSNMNIEQMKRRCPKAIPIGKGILKDYKLVFKGVADVIKSPGDEVPIAIWKITEEWKSYSADEPSELYIKSTKFGGALFTVFGIIIAILPFVLE